MAKQIELKMDASFGVIKDLQAKSKDLESLLAKARKD
jgi:hypothetical protein